MNVSRLQKCFLLVSNVICFTALYSQGGLNKMILNMQCFKSFKVILLLLPFNLNKSV